MNKGIVDAPLRDVITEILSKKGMSINGLFKELERKGIKIHRLTLTGYLIALRDMGVLKEQDIKPAKVFSIAPSKKRDFYQIIGEKARNISEENASDICLYVLFRIMNRPIFLRELNRAGVGMPRNYRKVVGDERKKALEIVAGAGITVPRNNSAFVPGDESYEEEFNQIVIDLISESYNIRTLAARPVQQKIID
ncbi:MAG: hypothetical protein GXO25_08120 [Euryarchaeota archaeon]|nr:hypothetical protein [Euryarchaeota archaeon]